MSRNVYGFYPAVEISRYPKNTGTPVSEVEAFIAKHGAIDLDANPKAKVRQLCFQYRNVSCLADAAKKKKQAKSEYKAALKNLDNGKAALRRRTSKQA